VLAQRPIWSQLNREWIARLGLALVCCVRLWSTSLSQEPFSGPFQDASTGQGTQEESTGGYRYSDFADEPAEGPELVDPYDTYDNEPYGYGSQGNAFYRPKYTAAGDYRQPCDLVFVDATTALIPTKLSGEIYELQWSTTDIARSQLRCVFRDPQYSWGAILAITPDLVAVAEHTADQVLLLRRTAGRWEIALALETPGDAHSLAYDAETRRLNASGLWSQQLYRWQGIGNELDTASNWQPLPPIDLKMCGGELLLLPKHNLWLVTDAFGRNYRLLDRTTGQVVKSEKVYGHNITALASVHDETMVLFPHQLLSETAQSVRNEITWGGVLSNNLRWLRVDRMLEQSGHDIMRQGRFYPLGTNGDGCGDPSSLAISADGLIAVTLGGTNRVALGREDDYYFRQVNVGYRPVSCAFSPDQRALVVVNQFSDSLTLIALADAPAEDVVHHLSLGELREPTPAERGEQAFFHSRLSHDGWMSCHSCHSQGHTSGQLNDNFTDGTFGTPKRILSLLGQAETGPYSWNGQLSDLETQIAHSIRSTMASDRPVGSRLVEDIAAYVTALPAPPSLSQARRANSSSGKRQDTAVADAGSRLFAELSCTDCHSGDWFTSPETYDVGLSDEAQRRRFNPPSLVAVSQRQDVLLHDGRASSLRDLLQNYPHQLKRDLTEPELDQLVAYLEGL
jgi:hypothetical protein